MNTTTMIDAGTCFQGARTAPKSIYQGTETGRRTPGHAIPAAASGGMAEILAKYDADLPWPWWMELP